MPKNIYQERIEEWEKQNGELSILSQKKLSSFIAQYKKTRSINVDEKVIDALQEGTKLYREFNGVKHEVQILEKGFSYKDKVYKSLSAIANKITGTHWNGKKFFGVAK